MAPLQTPTLPPATTTNCYIIGDEKLYIVEPAPSDSAEQRRLCECIDEMTGAGKKFAAILLTHHHADHVGAVSAISRRYRLPVRAHPLTYARIPEGYIGGTPLHDGEHIALGTAPDGTPGWHLEVMFTPGHAVDHVCFLESRYQAALVGDMLSTVSTIVIDPPEGHMRTYLNSLDRLLARPLKTVFPAHGPAHQDGRGLIRKLIEHRRVREQKIIQALATGASGVEDLLAAVYSDTAPDMHPIAARSLLAGLIKLEEDGVCVQGDGGWSLSSPGAFSR